MKKYLNTKPKIMHYYTDPINAGGPLTYLQGICESSLVEKYEFSVCYQQKAVMKLTVSDFRRIIREIKTFNPDILHVHGLQGEGFVGLICGKLSGCKQILMTVHGMEYETQTNSIARKFIFRYIIEPYILRKADMVYCVCHDAEKKRIIQKNARYLYPYIHNSIPEIVKFSQKPRSEFGLGDEDIIVVVVEGLQSKKG